MTEPARGAAPRAVAVAVVLGAITFSGPLAVHFFLPAMPVLRRELGIDAATAQAAFSVTLFVMAVATLFYGSLSDRFGRRAVLAGGLTLFVAGSAVCALSVDIASLIAGRLLQAVGAACGLVLARAIAYDIHGTDGAVRVIAYLTMAYSLGPMIAPPIGGLLVDGVGWRAIFAVAAIVMAVTLALAMVVLPGGRPAAAGAPGREPVLRGYARLLGNIRFSGFVFQSGMGSAAFFAFAAASAFVMSDVLQRPAGEYGLYFLFCPAGYWLGTLAAGRLGGRARIETMVSAGAAITFLAAASLAAVVLLGLLTPLTLFVPGFFITLGQGLALPNAQAGAIGTEPALAGTASGIGMFLQFFLGAAGSQLTGLLYDGSAVPMAAVVLGAACLGIAASALPWLAKPAAGGR